MMLHRRPAEPLLEIVLSVEGSSGAVVVLREEAWTGALAGRELWPV